MKRAFPKKMKPVPLSVADTAAIGGENKQAVSGPRRARTSAAMLGLALSMGASSILLPQQSDGAVAAEPLAAVDSSTPRVPSSPAQVPASGEAVNEDEVRASTTPEDSATSNSTGAVPSVTWVTPVRRMEARTDPEHSLPVNPIEVSNSPSLRVPSAEAAIAEPVDPLGSGVGEVTTELRFQQENALENLRLKRSRLQNSLDRFESEGEAIATPQEQDEASGTLTVEPVNPIAPVSPLASESPSEPETNRTRDRLPSLEDVPSDNEGETEAVSSESAIVAPTIDEPTATNEEVGRVRASSLQLPNRIERASQAARDSANAIEEPDLNNAIIIEPEATDVAASKIYQVNPGDTLDEIAHNNGISPVDLIAKNRLSDPNFIKVDQKLKIPLLSEENAAQKQLDTSEKEELATPSLPIGYSGFQTTIPTGENLELPDAIARRSEVEIADASTVEQGDRVQTTASAPVNLPLISGLSPSEPVGPIATPSLAENPLALEPEASKKGDKIDGLLSDIDKLRDKYRNQNAEFGTASENETEEPAPDNVAFGDREGRSANSEATANYYVDGLRAEIERLREKYRTENAELDVSLDAEAENESAATQLPGRQRNPEFDGVQSDRSVPNPGTQSTPDTTALPVPSADPREREQQTIAAAPLDPETYAPIVQPTIGQTVSPSLPPLKGPENYLPDAPARFNGYTWPAQGVLSSGYGWRWGRMHKGIDIAGPIGTPIYAAADGIVTFAGWNAGGYGNLVEIEHPDGSLTLYAHNHRILVREGQNVSQGEQVAEMGSTGFSTGPHLHFEIHPSGQGAVNPIAYLPAE